MGQLQGRRIDEVSIVSSRSNHCSKDGYLTDVITAMAFTSYIRYLGQGSERGYTCTRRKVSRNGESSKGDEITYKEAKRGEEIKNY